jgi:glucosamine--fructose-6-phosphate aminotransferase (isomerizing)
MQYLFGTANRLTVAFATPSLYTVYDAPPELGPAAAIGISQSGESPDVVAVLDEAKRQQAADARDHERTGVSTCADADWVLRSTRAKERAVAATKTYLNSIAAVALLSSVANGRQGAAEGAPACPMR